MKFDDSDKDYFLHNFDGDDSSSRQPSDAPSLPLSLANAAMDGYGFFSL